MEEPDLFDTNTDPQMKLDREANTAEESAPETEAEEAGEWPEAGDNCTFC